MSGEVGFALPDSVIFRTIAFGMIGGVAGVVYVVMTRHLALTVIMMVVGGLLAVNVMIYAMMKANKLVFLSAEGLKGRSRSGRINFFPWNEPVTIAMGHLSRLPSLRVEASDGEHLLIPLEIAKTPAFIHQLRQHAPAGHPVLIEAEKFRGMAV